MSIYIDSNTRVLVQGITGSEGGFHTRRMLEYGTNIVDRKSTRLNSSHRL